MRDVPDSAVHPIIHSGISRQMSKQPAVAGGASPVAMRGCLSTKQWADIRAAARTARDYGVQLVVHGVTVTAATNFGQRCPPDDAIASAPRRSAEPAAQRLTSAPVNDLSRTSKRQRRSSQRLAEFQAKKRASLLSASSRVRTFCRQFRWNRMQQVWMGGHRVPVSLPGDLKMHQAMFYCITRCVALKRTRGL